MVCCDSGNPTHLIPGCQLFCTAPFGPALYTPDMSDNETTDPTPEAPPTPETQYAPTTVNSQAHEQIQAGERAQVGQTVNVQPQ